MTRVSNKKDRFEYLTFLKWYIQNKVDLVKLTRGDFSSLTSLLNRPSNLKELFGVYHRKVHNGLLMKTASDPETMALIVKKFGIPLSFEQFLTAKENGKNSLYNTYIRDKKSQDQLLLSDEVKVGAKTVNKFQGCIMIDEGFIEQVLSQTTNFSKTDFYLAKQHDYCQWYGVVKGWDAKRRDYETILQQIVQSFERNSLISVVIYGAGGNGKSTLMRKLALDKNVQTFIVLWLTDIERFYKSDLDLIQKDKTNKYILFIENWPTLENELSIVTPLLNVASKGNNLKIIIADRTVTPEKLYKKYLFGNNQYLLDFTENSEIFEQLVELDPIFWKRLLHSFLRKEHGNMRPDQALNLVSEGFVNSPLYIVLFVFLSYANDKGGVSTVAMNGDFLSQFKDTITSVRVEICNKHEGLAKAIYYWASMCKRFKDNARITWQAFLVLADHYNENDILSKRFSALNEANSLPLLISNFLYIGREAHLAFNTIYDYLHFHHDLIMEELATPLKREWYEFDEYVILEVLEILCTRNHNVSGLLLLKAICKEEENGSSIFRSDQERESYFQRIALPLQNFADDVFSEACSKAKHGIEEEYLAPHFIYWNTVLTQLYLMYDTDKFIMLINQLINAGCTDSSVISICESYKMGNIEGDRHYQSVIMETNLKYRNPTADFIRLLLRQKK